jgi:hypothetical protein
MSCTDREDFLTRGSDAIYSFTIPVTLVSQQRRPLPLCNLHCSHCTNTATLAAVSTATVNTISSILPFSFRFTFSHVHIHFSRIHHRFICLLSWILRITFVHIRASQIYQDLDVSRHCLIYTYI